MDGKTSAQVQSKTHLVSANLHYTTDAGEVNQRRWGTLPADIDGERIVAEPPPPGTSIWLLTVRDERGAVVSSEVVFSGD